MKNGHEAGQVAATAAHIYERFFVPALFADWPARVLAAAQVAPGHEVLDVGCGTGVLARAAAVAVRRADNVTGLDINPGMLAVAREKEPDIRWHEGPAEALPFADASFDRVVSQFGLMFFADPVAALVEMRRVLRGDGRLTVAVWDTLHATPGYAAVADLLTELFGPDVAQSIKVPYSLGDTKILLDLFARAGMPDVTLQTTVGTARFASIDDWIYTEIKGWTLADLLDDARYAVLQRHARQRLARFVRQDGTVAFDAPAHMVTFIPS